MITLHSMRITWSFNTIAQLCATGNEHDHTHFVAMIRRYHPDCLTNPCRSCRPEPVKPPPAQLPGWGPGS